MARPLRTLIPVAAVLLATAASAPDQLALTYTTEAKRADIVVRELAAQTGLDLATTDDAKLHYLVVHVDDVDAEKMLATIATVTSSRWQVDGTKRTLMPDENKRRAEQNDRNTKRIKEFRDAQAKLKERLEEKPPTEEGADEEMRQMWEAFAVFESPGDKALAQLAQLIDPNEVARLGDDGRLVFSTAPNRMQRPMPAARANQILNALVDDHNKWAAEQLKQEEGTNEMMGDPEMAAYMAMFGERSKPKMFEGNPSKALLILEMEGTFFGFPSGAPKVELVVYDQKGTAVINSEFQMGAGWMDSMEVPAMVEGEEEGKETITEEQQQKILPEDRTIVQFSEKTKQFAALERMEGFSLDMPPGLIDILRDPVKDDPLSFHHTDMLLAIAKAKKLDLVANLADTDIFESFTLGAAEGGVSVGQAYNSFVNGSSWNLEMKDGWLVVSPKDPIKARTLRQDRAVLKQFIERIEREGTPTLDAMAQFALGSPSPMQNGTSAIYLMAFAPQTLQGMMGDQMDWPTLRFYGSLMPQQKTALRGGAQIPFSQLTQQARGILTNMSFSASANIKSAETMKKQEELPSFMQMMGGFMGGMLGGGAKSYTEEPTEVMPNGLPGNGYVELKLANEPILRPEGGGQAMFIFSFMGLGADELAMFEIMKESSQGAEMGEFFPMPKEAKLGNREKLNFSFWLSPVAGLSKTLTDDSVAKDAQKVSLDNLPANFRALIDQRKKAIKESPFGKLISMGIGQ